MKNHGTLQWPFNEFEKKSKSWLLFILWLLVFYYDKPKLYLFYLLPPRRFLRETHFGCTATRLSWKTSILLLRTFTRVHAISGCSLHWTLFEETLYFLRNINPGGMGTTSAQRATSSQLRWSFLVKTKRALFLKLASICKQWSTKKEKKTMVNLRSCCLLKIKTWYQLLKDLKSVASVKLVFFFANTFQATLHKIRNFEKFSNIRMRWGKSFTQNCAKQFLHWPPMLSDVFKAN